MHDFRLGKVQPAHVIIPGSFLQLSPTASASGQPVLQGELTRSLQLGAQMEGGVSCHSLTQFRDSLESRRQHLLPATTHLPSPPWHPVSLGHPFSLLHPRTALLHSAPPPPGANSPFEARSWTHQSHFIQSATVLRSCFPMRVNVKMDADHADGDMGPWPVLQLWNDSAGSWDSPF